LDQYEKSKKEAEEELATIALNSLKDCNKLDEKECKHPYLSISLML
jgi:hypothetical protein